MEPVIKFGDILTFSEGWYRVSGQKKPAKPVLFVATGKIKEEVPGHYIIYVVRENKSYTQSYHYSFLKKARKK